MDNGEVIERHTLSITVDNVAGILARISGMFSTRGYNIESLTVADVTKDNTISRVSIVTSGLPHVIDQMVHQLDRLPPVHRVVDLTAVGPHVERELALIKVVGVGDNRIEALRLAEVYHARVVDATIASFIFEVTGTTEKVEKFLELMGELGLVEVARTGIAAMARGRDAF
ncbi:MAG: acetolactate synthase small subunit [Zymomonas mobilis subsp. pomaceae]|uniref:Acetolactate synthase small subunit n=1 Tax=Zymomonas mobilis subsp. pomaceae (strain ATCC 29192 / DSM 22645 / JCM 10191 / CCUG 17912 / NBRC 13757 / NCIMB 11200 / NRRL B-4491 / Barker I) TaxID=579138 RepID=F8ETQ0_ZYMMT|nr:acetolactate synthase small subunit [Zymomonas mobilis]AEI37060.1 acetolactate synthase, small subunit [Zymomonas mobilis subsp. pomaceae ATCC 29192]MDX5948431.1 acetolactate synthase small subunit [Zymomonas mobilis subsp. pomaceae]GEB89505.1 acetolactate synthase small subunit [Zymomonas mobilis subsp. pomaceae]